jgi:benzoyl-CoA reductase/2-hydroxyglutaryl-CoA dehydratase subunit BcrC/BadD/HgdB
MIDSPRWSADQLAADMKKAAEVFKKERLEEPVEAYGDAFDRFQGNVEELFETTVDLSRLSETALNILTNRELLNAFRYLAGPPISIDDLKTVAEADSLQGSDAQNRGLTLFWGHNLAPLTEWIETTRP